MTRVLVCGASIVEDASFVFDALCEANRIYGPFTCVIHNNHPQALAWQQWAMRKQIVKHLPITENFRKDGVAAGDRCRDRMFEARPDYVIIFEYFDKDEPIASSERRSKAESIMHRAQSAGKQVIKYVYNPIEEKIKKAAAKAAFKPSPRDIALGFHRPSMGRVLQPLPDLGASTA